MWVMIDRGKVVETLAADISVVCCNLKEPKATNLQTRTMKSVLSSVKNEDCVFFVNADSTE